MDERVITALIAATIAATTAALIAGTISAAGVLVAVLLTRSARTQRPGRTEAAADLREWRFDVHPRLWAVITRHETNWSVAGQPKTHEWARRYLADLSTFYEGDGVFLSRDVDTKFRALRTALVHAINDTVPGAHIGRRDIAELRTLVHGVPRGRDQPGHPGLSRLLKDDLGSVGESESAR